VLHAPNPIDVVRCVEAEAPGRAGRLEQTIPPLPRAKKLRSDAGASTELADAEKGGFHGADYTTSEQLFDKPRRSHYSAPRTVPIQDVNKVRKLDLLAATLLIVGGLNWGLVAVAEFDLVAWIFGLEFGETNAVTRIVYGLVGLAAVYGIGSLVSRARSTSPAPIGAH
jgi:uncharacterized membrane protein YuzA (DUF378 family)